MLCNRLVHKIDRGFEISEQKLKHVESVLDDRSRHQKYNSQGS